MEKNPDAEYTNIENKNLEIISNNKSALINTGYYCKICFKDIKNNFNLVNHNIKFHMVKGANVLKCGNCGENLTTKITCNITSQRNI